jgi:UDP-glucuronate decarboxylase
MIFDEITEITSQINPKYYDGKTVLITGGAGFIGSWVCESLLALGANVICIDNFESGKIENISHLKSNSNFTFREHDVSIPFDSNVHLDYVFHMASRTGPFSLAYYPIETIRANTIGTMHALDIAAQHHAKFTYTSTSEIYGEPSVFPTPETYWGYANSIGPRSSYDESKRCGEAMCMAYLKEKAVDVRIVRFFNTYGPRIRADGIYGRVIPRFIDQITHDKSVTIFGDGKQTRSFSYVTDTVIGFLRLAAEDGLTGEVVNIGSPDEITIMELAETIYQILGKTPNYEYHPMPQDDPHRRLPDITKAEKLLSWKAKISLKEGINQMIMNDSS